MLGDGDRGILRDITSYLGGALLDDEASESAKVNIVVAIKEFLTFSMNASTIVCTKTFSAPVLLAISLTISALVIAIRYFVI